MKRAFVPCLFVLLPAAGCEKRVESTAPTLGALTPQVICNAQLTTRLSVAGTNLTPLPIRALGGVSGGKQPTSSQLPAFSLVQSAGLDGSPTSGPPIQIPDNADAVETSPVHWQSERSMSFDVFPGLMLQEGVHDLVVTNPDGQSATLPHALAVTPPPTVTKVEPPAICDAQTDQNVVITGTGFLQIGTTLPEVRLSDGMGSERTYAAKMAAGCVEVARAVTPGLQLCTSLSIVVQRGDLHEGKYTVTVTNPSPADCASSQPITITVAPPPTVDSVAPTKICLGGGVLDVRGMDFQEKALVTLGMSQADPVKFVSSTELQATFGGAGAMFVEGMKYDLTVTNPDGCLATLKAAVEAVPGPVLFFADPPVVYNGITTQVALYATFVTLPLGMVTITPSGGGAAITLSAIMDPNHPQRVLATVPQGTPAGQYDVTVSDATPCPSTLPKALTIIDKATITLTGITPNFGWRDGTTPVVVGAAGGLQATPRVYLNPHKPGPNSVATALASVSFVSETRVAAVVPKGLAPDSNPYDVIVVNPDGTVGVLTMPDSRLYNSEVNPPPVIDSISPGAVPATNPPAVTISGANFRMPSVTFNCITDLVNGTRTDFPAVVSNPTATSITINSPPVTMVPTPSLCRIRVTNGDDQTWAEFSALAISNSSGNLSPAKAGTPLPSARRAPAVLGGFATRVNRFLYAIGGDSGTPAGALDTVVTTSTDENGTGAAWFTQRYKLNKPRTLAGYAALGRYLYVVGGNDGTGPVASAERAMVLDPQQAPVVGDVDIARGGGMGLGGGAWFYRVAALMDPADPDNPGGETLPSDVVSLQLPDLPQKVKVTLSWSAVAGAVGYRIYRTASAGMIAGQETQLADVMGANVLTFTDQGDATGDGTPLVQGSTGKWRPLPLMTSKRESPGVAFGTDPNDPTKRYLYATLGRDANALGGYEFLAITVANGNGQQALPNAWTVGVGQVGVPRYQHAVYSADHDNCSFVPAGKNFIYLGGGTVNGSNAENVLEAAPVQGGGQLGLFGATGATIKNFGMGFTVAANYLYTFGDETPSVKINAGQITENAAPAVGNVNANGPGMLKARYLPGTALQGALIYNVGGSDVGRSAATTSVEWMIW